MKNEIIEIVDDVDESLCALYEEIDRIREEFTTIRSVDFDCKPAAEIIADRFGSTVEEMKDALRRYREEQTEKEKERLADAKAELFDNWDLLIATELFVGEKRDEKDTSTWSIHQSHSNARSKQFAVILDTMTEHPFCVLRFMGNAYRLAQIKDLKWARDGILEANSGIVGKAVKLKSKQ